MIEVNVAEREDLDGLVQSVAGLFEEDAGRYDAHSDATWPGREGAAYYGEMLDDSACLLLVARREGAIVGHLVGLVSEPTPTRLNVRFAVLQSLRVHPASRNEGVGHLLTTRFLEWGRANGCVQGVVSAYANNEGAQRFYRRHGFVGQSLTSVIDLGES